MSKAQHPTPEVVARPAEDAEIPANARKLAQLARDAGCRVWITYARGTSLPTRTKPEGELIESIAVRMRGEAGPLVAIWSRPLSPARVGIGSMRFVWGGAPFQSMTLAEIREAVQS